MGDSGAPSTPVDQTRGSGLLAVADASSQDFRTSTVQGSTHGAGASTSGSSRPARSDEPFRQTTVMAGGKTVITIGASGTIALRDGTIRVCRRGAPSYALDACLTHLCHRRRGQPPNSCREAEAEDEGVGPGVQGLGHEHNDGVRNIHTSLRGIPRSVRVLATDRSAERQLIGAISPLLAGPPRTRRRSSRRSPERSESPSSRRCSRRKKWRWSARPVPSSAGHTRADRAARFPLDSPPPDARLSSSPARPGWPSARASASSASRRACSAPPPPPSPSSSSS